MISKPSFVLILSRLLFLLPPHLAAGLVRESVMTDSDGLGRPMTINDFPVENELPGMVTAIGIKVDGDTKGFDRTTGSHGKVIGWPSILRIEIDELEVGGVAIPVMQTLLQNSKVGYENFGNIDLDSPDAGPLTALSLSPLVAKVNESS
ncbi:hypothetical protein FBU30_009168 [Linnemannia zychae]|nr:hypothetical protein FBU30_009168 [Linnemannia zychae]